MRCVECGKDDQEEKMDFIIIGDVNIRNPIDNLIPEDKVNNTYCYEHGLSKLRLITRRYSLILRKIIKGQDIDQNNEQEKKLLEFYQRNQTAILEIFGEV